MDFIILGTFALYRDYQTNTWPPVIHDLACMGNETSLFDCAYSLVDTGRACGYDASVICQGKYLESAVASIIIIIISHLGLVS